MPRVRCNVSSNLALLNRSMNNSVQLDPLDSPHPIPWSWIVAIQTQASAKKLCAVRHYRSSSLISPDGCYAAYSRISMKVDPVMVRSRVSSVAIVENLKTGQLRTLCPTSPLAENPFDREKGAPVSGTISIAVPISWSHRGDRLLVRVFESLFCSDIASDYALVWDRESLNSDTVAPTEIQYTHAVLLGWSDRAPDSILFRAGKIGGDPWSEWRVEVTGKTSLAKGDRPVIMGKRVNTVWSGPQLGESWGVGYD